MSVSLPPALRAFGLCSMMLLASAAAWAQSDADKATARTLAEQGIALKDAGKYEDALEKLTSAQEIFDAPTHMLLIAQCQVALGRLVEGAETYRKLQRRRLEATAPPAFRQAQERAVEELAAVEPRIPKIHLTLQPDGLQGLHVRIDDVQVPSAVVGVDRLINPGHHVIEIAASGYETSEVQVQLSEKQVLPVEVKLKRSKKPSHAAPSAKKRHPKRSRHTASRAGGSQEPSKKKKDRGMELLTSVHLETAFPSGDFGTSHFEQGDVQGGNVSNSFGPGGGIELQGALRFADHWGAAVLLGVDGFSSVSSNDYGADLQALFPDATEFATKDSSAPYVGMGAQWYSCPDCLGLLAEVSLMLRDFTQTVEFKGNPMMTDEKCRVTIGRRSTMLRLLAGFQIPVTGELTVTPFTSFSTGSVPKTKIESDGTSTDTCPTQSLESTDKSEDSGVEVVTLGVAGTMSFGL